MHVLFPILLPQRKFSPKHPPYQGDQEHFLFTPEEPVSDPDKPIRSSPGNQGSGYCKACLPQPLAVHPVPEGTPLVTLNGLRCPPLGFAHAGLRNRCPSHRSRVGCCVFSHPHNRRAGAAPASWQGEQERFKAASETPRWREVRSPHHQPCDL